VDRGHVPREDGQAHGGDTICHRESRVSGAVVFGEGADDGGEDIHVDATLLEAVSVTTMAPPLRVVTHAQRHGAHLRAPRVVYRPPCGMDDGCCACGEG
jgi:hypothetical protein